MVFASNNKGKLQEIRSILGENIKSLKDLNINIDVVEDGNTFYENALKKAKEIYNVCKEPVIADDSGLCIDILDDFPGVMTARFLGENATDRDRNNYILEKLEHQKKRDCRVICALVYYDGIKELYAEGIIYGTISKSPCGNNGFGFDEIVELEDGRTLAELTSEEKNKISARYLAAIQLKQLLNDKTNNLK